MDFAPGYIREQIFCEKIISKNIRVHVSGPQKHSS